MLSAYSDGSCPAWWGRRQPLTQQTLNGATPLIVVAGIVVIRWFLGPVSYSISAPGGLFAPLPVLGAGIGALFGRMVMWGVF